MKLFRRKKKIKPLNFSVLNAYRCEALSRLKFWGTWSGYWETVIDNVRYRSEIVSGFKYISGDYGNFIRDSILDRVRLRKDKKNKEIISNMIRYGNERFVDNEGNVDWWNF